MTCIRKTGLGILCAVAVTTTTWAQSVPSEEPSIVGCGKSNALIAAWEHKAQGPPEGGVAEAMGETDVLHYNLDIELTNINTSAHTCTITGTNTMTVQSKSNNLEQFTIRLGDWFTITSARVNNIQVIVSNNTNTTWTVTLDRPYAMDEVFTLMIAYTGTPQNVGLGSFQVTTHSGTAVVATLSEPYYAYSWWPVKDGDVNVPGDNSDKATVEMSVTTPNNFSVAGNGTLQDVQTLSGNRKKYHWASSSEMSTYLASFGTTNYTTWTKTYNFPGGTMPVEFYIYPENDTPSNRAGWEKTTDMMTAFRPLFGEYPFVSEKYGLYNFPFSGGMEHQTMTGQSGFNESLTSHELTHQWWGDNVTCKTWEHIWLNEGFATYGEALWLEFKSGASDQTALTSAMTSRKPSNFGLTATDTVYVPPSQTSNAGRIFNSDLSYRKGAWVLHQLRHVVGSATFFQILANYRAQYEGGAATTDDFAAVASTTYGQDLKWFFDEMVYTVGSPAYRWGFDTIDIGGQKYLHVRIEQTQTNANYLNVYTMPIDIVASNPTGGKQTVTVWNDQRSQRFVSPLGIIPTQVNFDPDQWVLRMSQTTRTLMIGDMDDDNDVDSADFNAFSACFSGANHDYDAGCQAADMDGDGDVDCTDLTGWQTTWTAGGSPPSFIYCGATGPVPATSTWGLVVFGLAALCLGTLICRGRHGQEAIPA